jgi:hypothetical protein
MREGSLTYGHVFAWWPIQDLATAIAVANFLGSRVFEE